MIEEDEDEDEEEEKMALLGPRYSDKQLRMFERRGLYLGVALFQSIWISGTVYGWPAFLLMLRAEHLYANRCGTDELIEHHPPSQGNNTTIEEGIECPEQEILFNRIATSGISSLLISLFVMGLCLDRFGPRITAESLFIGYAFVLLFIGVSCFFLWPDKAFQPMTDNNVQNKLERSDSEDSMEPFEEMETEEERRKRMAQERIAELKCRSFWQQLFSAPWWVNAVFTAVNIFGLQYYISTGPDQLLRMGDYDATYTVLLNVITPLGALGIPIYGWLMDKKGFALSYAVINLLGIGINVLALIPVLPLQIVTFAFWAAYRLLGFSACYAFVAKVFGDTNFGTLNGLTLSSTGIINFSQILITKMVVEHWGGSFFYPNVGFILARLPLFWVSYYFWQLGV
ncbi:uncharacterized protein ACA1_183430 [Acanthamoeba castellanii str. Neff]|uniref:Transporter, major facilitator subfamily protein n=1 Tax=Acanthamoeba castellanii (strain ATCC 30010 / Neff) TaxID=1257118 RepID=L8H791_ACACF|nr:uncharacterized protein ACA1_183430 [Acanthamoeba castellanii str. Neff]ELR21409.1 hypothetical protein ACA1_183430 [Acanthamoeba castellanii str. Neff]